MESADSMQKKCWSSRADRVNFLPVLGKFTHVPPFINDNMLCNCLTTEWRQTCKILRGVIMREPTRLDSQRSYAMTIPGGEKTRVGSQ